MSSLNFSLFIINNIEIFLMPSDELLEHRLVISPLEGFFLRKKKMLSKQSPIPASYSEELSKQSELSTLNLCLLLKLWAWNSGTNFLLSATAADADGFQFDDIARLRDGILV